MPCGKGERHVRLDRERLSSTEFLRRIGKAETLNLEAPYAGKWLRARLSSSALWPSKETAEEVRNGCRPDLLVGP